MAITLTPAQRAVAISVLAADQQDFANQGESAAEWALDWLLLSAVEKRARFVALLDARKTVNTNTIAQLDTLKTTRQTQLTNESSTIDTIEATL